MEMLRDSSIGHIARFLSRDKVLAHKGELEKFEAGLQKAKTAEEDQKASQPSETPPSDSEDTKDNDVESANSVELEKTRTLNLQTRRTSDGSVLVGWYSGNDPENPQNWSTLKQYSVGTLIWYTPTR